MIDGIPNRPLYFYQKDIIGMEGVQKVAAMDSPGEKGPRFSVCKAVTMRGMISFGNASRLLIFWPVKVGDTHMGRPYFAVAFWLAGDAGEANMYQRLPEYRSNQCSVPFLQCFQIDQTGDCPPVWPDQQWPAPRLSSDQSGRKQLSPLRHVCLRPGNQGI